MLALSKSEGSGGRIKGSPEGFIVKEITDKGMILEPGRGYSCQELGYTESVDGKFSTFVLQKKDWNTIQALITISKRLGHGKGAIGYAGVKDRTSISTQLASIFGAKPEGLLGIRVKDLEINGAWRSDKGVEMGSNLGNAFQVTIEGVDRPEAIEGTIRELDGKMPNYFDRQRFGSRLNNAKIGMALMKGDFESAAMHLLLDTEGEENAKAVEARKMLAENRDFANALQYFPGYLKGERSMLAHLSTQSNDYAGAIRKLPRGITIMFIHAVEALVFNGALERRIREGNFDCPTRCKSNSYGFPDVSNVTPDGEHMLAPLVGYETSPESITSYEAEMMDRLGVSGKEFNIKSMPELSMKGAMRAILAPVKDIAYEVAEGNASVRFSIPAGSYATIMLNEITKREGLDINRLL